MALALKLRGEGKSREAVTQLFSDELERVCKDESRWQDEAHLGDVLDMMVDYFVPTADNHAVRQFIAQFRTEPRV